MKFEVCVIVGLAFLVMLLLIMWLIGDRREWKRIAESRLAMYTEANDERKSLKARLATMRDFRTMRHDEKLTEANERIAGLQLELKTCRELLEQKDRSDRRRRANG